MATRQLSDGSGDGEVLGQSATDLIAFYGATPVVRPTNADQAAITDSSGGTKNAATGVALTGGYQLITQTFNLADLLGTDEHKIDPGFNGKLISINARVQRAATTSAKAASLQARVNGASMTGGVVALTSAACTPAGTQVAGSAITAGTQTFTSGQTIGFLLSGVTTFIEGSVVVEYLCQNTDLANSVATIVAQNNAYRTALVNLGLVKGS